MALSWALTTYALLVLIALMLMAASQHSGTSAWPTWTLVLSSPILDRRRYSEHAADLADELKALDATLRLARRQSGSGDFDGAQRTLAIAARHVGRHVPTLRDRLATWREAVRVLSAVGPVPRLRTRTFSTWRLRGLSVGESLVRLALDHVHQVLLRIHVLLYGLTVVLGGFAPRHNAEVGTMIGMERRMRRLEALRSDLGVLQQASLDVCWVVLLSLQEARRAKS